MASPSPTPYSLSPRMALTFNAGDLVLMRAVRDALAELFGRASYVSAIRYGLTLAHAQLTGQGAPPTLAVPQTDAPADPH